MSLIALNLPDDAAEWPPWLERQLLGADLRQLVGELLPGQNRIRNPTCMMLAR